MECFLWKWLYYWCLVVDGILGILTFTVWQPHLSLKAAKKYAKCKKREHKHRELKMVF